MKQKKYVHSSMHDLVMENFFTESGKVRELDIKFCVCTLKSLILVHCVYVGTPKFCECDFAQIFLPKAEKLKFCVLQHYESK